MKYDAFISYRHAELDQFVAENLHKKLEAFRLPNSIVKQRGKDCKKKIERVFRDRDELPLATNLADPITEALENSEFLIVICSPRLPQSLWCKKEIETFISMHGREHVLAVLIEGEPDESFPEELLYRTREVTKEDGTVEVIKEAVEPLAADVRGTTKKEVLKKMDEELLRLAAAMFECAYDDLKQRHKEQKMKKMLTASLAASAFFLVFGAVSTTMAIRIQSQKEQIQAQSEEIQAKSEEIQAQKEEIEVQYQQALYNQSLSMAEKSLDLLNEGDRLEAMKLACDALGETEDGTPMPVTAEAQYALAESSYLYQDGENWIPMYMLKHDANISMIQASPNREQLLTADQYGNIYIWDVLSNKIIGQTGSTSLANVREESCFYINDTQILHDGEEGFDIYDVEKQEIVFSSGEGNFYHGAADGEQQWFAVVVSDFLNKFLMIYDTTDFSLLHTYAVPEGKTVDYAFAFDGESNTAAFIEKLDYLSGKQEPCLVTMDLGTGEITGRFPLDYSNVEGIQIVDGVLYVSVGQSIDEASPDGTFSLTATYKSVLYALNLSDLSVKWEHRNDGENIKDVRINDADFSRHIMVSYYSGAQMLDMDTGIVDYTYAFGHEITATYYYTTSDLFVIMLRDGEFHLVSGESGEDIVFDGFFQSNSDNLLQMIPIANGYATLPYLDCNVTYYEVAKAPEREVLFEQEISINSVHVNKAENRAVLDCGYNYDPDRKIVLMDLESNVVLKEIPWGEDYGIDAGIVGAGENYFYAFSTDSISIYNIEDGSLYNKYTFEDSYFPDNISTSSDEKAILFVDSTCFGKIMIEDGSVEIINYELGEDYTMVASINHAFNVYAAADKEENAILLYRVGEEEAYAKLDAVAPLVSEMIFTEDDRHLFVFYVDKTAAVFDLESLSCVYEYNVYGSSPYGIVTLGEEGYLAQALGGGYLLNGNFEVLACLPGGKAVMPKAQQYLCVDDKTLYICPIYTTEQLLEKSKEILIELNAYE